MKPSKYQEAIYAFTKDSAHSLMVEAVAGSGKTTTMVTAGKLLPDVFCRYMAFNKSIAAVLQTKVTGIRSEVSTMHSLGLSLLRKEGFKGRIDGYKVRSLCWEDIRKFKGVNKKQQSLLANTAQQVISYTKQQLCEDVSEQTMLECLDYFGVEIEDFDLLPYVQGVWKKMVADKKTIDFDDMIYLPTLRGLNDPTDVLFLDEVQDLNKMQQHFCLLQASRIVAFGDSRQAIYGFAGADTEGMRNLRSLIQQKLGPCESLPLSICYRCPSKVIDLAKTIVPQIEASPGAPEGLVHTVPYCKAKVGQLVLCRTTAPLVKEAMGLWGRGVKACVLGKNMGEQIEAAMEKWGNDVWASFKAWDEGQRRRLENRRVALRYHVELRDVLQVLLDQCGSQPTREGVFALIDKLFSDIVSEQSVNLMTIHRSKGLEADTVWLLRPDLIPHPMSQEGWQRDQEEHLRYVAYTRSMNNLLIVSEQEDLEEAIGASEVDTY